MHIYLINHIHVCVNILDESAALTAPDMTPPETLPKQRGGKALRPDYPKGLNCKKCSKTFYWREKLKDHYRQHGLEEGNGIGAATTDSIQMSAPGTSLLKHNTFQYHLPQHDNNNVNTIIDATNIGHNNSYNSTVDANVIDAQAIVDAAVAEAQAASMQMNLQMNQPAPDIIMDIPVATTTISTTTTMPLDSTVNASDVNSMQQQAVTVMSGYACPQIPSDAIPQVVETDTTIDNSELDFVFNDALFEDFEEDENEDEENEEDDGTDFQDLLLTSDDDFDDMLQDQQQQQHDAGGEAGSAAAVNSSNYQPYCVHCNKKFLSQYQFENHMFVHRGRSKISEFFTNYIYITFKYLFHIFGQINFVNFVFVFRFSSIPL